MRWFWAVSSYVVAILAFTAMFNGSWKTAAVLLALDVVFWSVAAARGWLK